MIIILIMSYLISASFVAFRVEFFISNVWHEHDFFFFFPGKLQSSSRIWLREYIVLLIIQVYKLPVTLLRVGTFKVWLKNLLVEKSLSSVLKRCLMLSLWESYQTNCKPLKRHLWLAPRLSATGNKLLLIVLHHHNRAPLKSYNQQQSGLLWNVSPQDLQLFPLIMCQGNKLILFASCIPMEFSIVHTSEFLAFLLFTHICITPPGTTFEDNTLKVH